MSFDYSKPLTGQHLVEASAGTGKTHLLTTLYLRLILGRGTAEGRALRPQEILVVTFTIAATQALKGRIRARLNVAYLDFSRGVSKDDDIQVLISSSPDLQLEAKRLKHALLWFDEASIFTIHGFCARILQDRGFDAGLRLDLSVTQQSEDLLLQAAQDVYRRLGEGLPVLEKALAFNQWGTPTALAQAMAPLLNAPNLRFHPEAHQDRFEPMLAEDMLKAKSVWITEDINTLLKASELKKNVKAWHRIDSMTDFCRDQTLSPESPLWHLWARDALITAVKKGTTPPDHPVFDQLQAISRRLSIQDQVISGIWQSTLAEIRHKLDQAQRAGELTMDNLLTLVQSAVSSQPMAAQALSADFPVMLIDEFQDTDHTQYSIFRSIHQAGSSLTNLLLLIGDPKQAIYRFRGADIHTYLKAREESEHTHTLEKNWRSSRPLVTATNQLFDQPGLFTQNDSIRFLPSEAQRDYDVSELTSAQKPVPPIWFLRSDPTFAITDKPRDQQALATMLARQLQTWLSPNHALRIEGKPVCASQIAVLTRDRNEANLIKQTLQAHGIKSVLLSQDRILDQPISRALATFLKAALRPNDPRAVVSALTTPLLRVDISELQALQDSELALQAALDEFMGYAKIWQQQGIAALIIRLIDARELGPRWLADPDGARVLTDLRHLAELLQQQSLIMPDHEQLLRWLTLNHNIDNQNLDDTQQLRLDTDGNLVTLMTFHGAKGLEFDVVCLPFAHFGQQTKPSRLKDLLSPILNPDGLCETWVNLNQDPMLKAATERANQEEDMRLMYVAMTRAKHLTLLGIGSAKGYQQSVTARLLQYDAENPSVTFTSMPSDLYQVVDPDDMTTNSFVMQETDANGQYLPALDKPSPKLDWRIHSYSGIKRAALTVNTTEFNTHHNSQTLAQGFEDDDWSDGTEVQTSTQKSLSNFVFSAFPRGPLIGVHMHTLLEKLDFTQSIEQQAITSAVQARLGLPKDHEALFLQWINTILTQPLTASGLTLGGLQANARADELEFHFPLGGSQMLLQTVQDHGYLPYTLPSQLRLDGMMTGSIDLLCRWQGRYYIIDYKTNHLGDHLSDYSRDQLQVAIDHSHYDLQYLIYSVALKKMLALTEPDTAFESLFGGVIYLFLRGMIGSEHQGVYFDAVDCKAIAAIEDCLHP